MRFNSGFSAAATAGALLLLSGLSSAQAGGFGGGGHGGGHGGGFVPSALPGIGVGAYAPGQGPTGAAGWNGGAWRGYTDAYGPIWGGGGYYGGGAGGGNAAYGGAANVYTYNHYDNRRRDGGFYGGGGVFYGDDGYSRLYAARPSPEGRDDDVGSVKRGRTGYAPNDEDRPSRHIVYLDDDDQRPTTRNGARRAADH